MAAIVTKTFKKQVLDRVFDELNAGTVKYYVGIGRSEAWDSSDTPPAPTDTPRTVRNFRLSAQSVKQATDVTYVIPRYNWTTSTIFSAWDDDLSGTPTNAYYVLTDDNRVYACLKQSKDAAGNAVVSTVKPNDTDTGKPFKTSDGYVWKFMYALDGTTASKFLSSNFIPVAKIGDSSNSVSLTANQQVQAAVQENAPIAGITSIKVTAPGTGYSSTPTVTIHGNGTGAAATATVSGGTVVKIELDSSADSCMKMGHGYQYASVAITGGGGAGAKALAVISSGDDSGFGGNAINDLKSSSLMFNVKPAGAENKDFIIGNQDFRQVSLMRAPYDSASGALYTATTGRIGKYLKVTSVSDASNLQKDVEITGQTSGAKAVIDDIDSDRVYAHQSEDTGFKVFAEGETIQGGGQSATLDSAGSDADSDAWTAEDLDKFKNEVLYIENRAPVERTSTQTEDIKVVITL